MFLVGQKLHRVLRKLQLRRAHVLFRALKPLLIVFQTNNTVHNKTPLVQGGWHSTRAKGKMPPTYPKDVLINPGLVIRKAGIQKSSSN